LQSVSPWQSRNLFTNPSCDKPNAPTREPAQSHSPFEKDAKEPSDGPHEVNFDTCSQPGLKPLCNVVARGKGAHEIVHIASHIEGCVWEVGMSPSEDAWIMDALLKPHVKQVASEVVEPVARGAAHAAQGFSQFPMDAWSRDQISRRGDHNYKLVATQAGRRHSCSCLASLLVVSGPRGSK
jgi:hypothetical protein